MQKPLPRWFAHRGGGSLAPENTLAGIRLAASMGYRAVEFDVMLSGDGTPVLIHDETLERTTSGHGEVCLTADKILFSLDAGGGERVPRFAEAAALCRELGLLANVEIKPAGGHEIATAEAISRMAAAFWNEAPEQVLISSFSLTALEVARKLAPGLRRGALFETVPDDWPDILTRLQAVSLHCDAAQLADTTLREAGERGVPVLCYTVNRLELAGQLLARGVCGMFTDRLDIFVGEAPF